VDEIDAEAQFAGLAQKADPHDARQQRFRGVEKAVDDPADDERRKREDGVVIGLPRARHRQFRHPWVVVDERELRERRGEEKGERRDPGDPSGRGGEMDAAVGDQRIEKDAADERVGIVVEPERHPGRCRQALVPRDRDRDAPAEIGQRQHRGTAARSRRRQRQRQDKGR
jgi:hypothetical protein